MSRLTQPAIVDGDPINAAGLNDRFNQFNQSGTINQFNTRDAAFDLPHFATGNNRFLAPEMAVAEIGWNDWKHGSFHTYTGQTTGAAPHRVRDSGGTDERLSFGATGWTLQADDALRVFWDLSVRPRWEGAARPWLNAALTFELPVSGGGTAKISNGYGCWAFWLQWDVTDNTLANFVNIPGQGDFNSVVVGARGGNALNACKSTSVVPAIVEYADVVDEGALFGSIVTTPVGWTSVDGVWHYVHAGAALTVYGIRVVFSGPFGAYHSGVNNYLVRNDVIADNARLDQQAGSIQALQMRTR